MSFNFFKNFAKVKGEQLEEGLVNLAVALDNEAAAESAIKQKIEEHEARISMLQEANASYRKEQREYEQEQVFFDRLMNEAEAIQSLLDKGEGDTVQLNKDLTKIVDKIEERAPILDREKAEAEEAKQWLDEMQTAVDEISKELLTLRETVNKAKQEIQRAELEKEKQRKKAEQAEVLAGLKKSGNKYDTALNALKKTAEKNQAEAEKYKLKAESLKKDPGNDVTNIIGKYSEQADTSFTNMTASERLAKLKR